MEPELWIGIVAVFVSGGAVGSAGVLLAQWFYRKLGEGVQPLEDARLEMLRAEVDEITRQLDNVDQRLEFQERLLGGQTPTEAPPQRLPASPPADTTRGRRG